MLMLVATVLPVAGTLNKPETLGRQSNLSVDNNNYFSSILDIVKGDRGTSANDDWPMFHHDPQHTGYSTALAPSSSHVLWKHATNHMNDLPSPIVANDKLYMVITNLSKNNEPFFQAKTPIDISKNPFEQPCMIPGKSLLYCLDAGNGTEQWKISLDTIMCESTPAFADNKIFIGGDDALYCYDALTGTKIWNTTPIYYASYSSPCVTESRVYCGGFNGTIERGRIYSIDAANGDIKWTYVLGYELIYYTSPAFADGKIYATLLNISSGDINLLCLDAAAGTYLWSYSLGGGYSYYGAFQTPTVTNGKVYCASLNSTTNKGELYCLNAATGAKIWTYILGIDETMFFSSPAVAYGKYFAIPFNFTYGENRLLCLDATTGGFIWNSSIETYGIASSPAIADNKIYFNTGDQLYCYDVTDGSILWSYTLEAGSYSPPAISNERVYTADRYGNIYAFEDVLKVITHGGIARSTARLTNRGLTNLSNITWTFTATGNRLFGILGKINVSTNGTISLLKPGDTTVISVKPLLGFGKANMTLQIVLPDCVIKKTWNALLLGFLVINIK